MQTPQAVTQTSSILLTPTSFENFSASGIQFNEQDYKRFISHIDGITPNEINIEFQNDRCYLWNIQSNAKLIKGKRHGSFCIAGYPHFLSHHIMYLFFNAIPVDVVDPNDPCPCESGNRYQSCCRFVIRHRCVQITGQDSNGQCVNPLHLMPGDQHANQHDIRVDGTGRGQVQQGSEHHNASIDEPKAQAIWEDIISRPADSTLDGVAIKHNVSLSIVKDISCGRTWNHVSGISNEKRIENVRSQNDKSYFLECTRRKNVLEAKGIEYFGDVPPPKTEEHKPTTRFCKGPLCLKQNSTDGIEKEIDQFQWKTKDHLQRRSQCNECKNYELRTFRSNKKRKREEESPKEKEHDIDTDHIHLHTSGCQTIQCLKCMLTKRATDFPFHNKPKLIHIVYCRDCWNIMQEEAYRSGQKYCQRCIKLVRLDEISSAPIWCKLCRRLDERERNEKKKELIESVEHTELKAGQKVCNFCYQVKSNFRGGGNKCLDCTDTVAKASRRNWYHANKESHVGSKLAEQVAMRMQDYKKALKKPGSAEDPIVQCNRCNVNITASQLDSKKWCYKCRHEYDQINTKKDREQARLEIAVAGGKVCPSCGKKQKMDQFTSTRRDASCNDCKKEKLRANSSAFRARKKRNTENCQ